MTKPHVSYYHILFTGPLLLYLGLAKSKPIWVYYALLAFASLAGLYFIYELMKNTKRYWFIIHVLIFVPLLILMGIQKDKTPPIVLSVFIALGFASIGYHILRLLQNYQVISS